MYKQAVVSTFSFLLLTSLCYAQNEERLTLTTYYPAPYGTYQQLAATDKFLVCDTADVATNLGDMSDTSPDAAFMGNVGIGVTDPYTKLQFGSINDRISWRNGNNMVNATIGVEQIGLVDYVKTEQFVTAPTPAPFLSAYTRIAETADLTDRDRDWFFEATDKTLRIYRGSMNNWDVSGFHIVTDASGQNLQGIGIGTNAPITTLDVRGQNGNGGIYLGYSHALYSGNTGTNDFLGVEYTADGLQYDSTPDGQLFAGRLDAYNIYALTDAFKPGGGSWGVLSDIRLKDVTGKYKLGLSEIIKLNPVRFNYKENNDLSLPSDKEFIGLVAQEVEPFISEAVSKDDKGYLVMNNDPIIWAMLNAIKELKTENDKLKERVAVLEAK